LAAGGVGWVAGCDSPGRFVLFWFAVAVAALAGSFVVMRRQALRAKESFWSPPTRRVAQAMVPCLFIGFIAGLAVGITNWGEAAWLLVPAWMALYGAALNAAGFFMPRGIKVLGWLFIVAGMLVFLGSLTTAKHPDFHFAHAVMGGAFGGLHLAYGIYLQLTERRTAP
jgi:hypothetical protein